MSQEMDPQQIEALAQQLARQLASMRGQQSGSHSAAASHASTLPSTNQNTAEPASDSRSGDSMAELATQLGGLLGGRVKEPAQGTASTLSAVDPYASVSDPSIYEKEFTDTYLRVNASVLRFEDMQLLDLACEQMPVDRFYEEAEAMSNEYPDDSTDDIVVRRLLHWFKNEYFTWVNEPPCVNCQAKTVAIGGAAPTTQERQDGAGVVETYRCTQSCTAITRFPRYGGISKILFTTRRGRCGEWANCFTVCCRALGFKARYVHDTTDHVWTEVWSEHKKRWVHCDACEAAYDQPLLYTTGWGKSLSYCVAFSAEEVVDVTRRYTIEYDTVVLKRRRSIREPVLAKFLHLLSESNLASLSLDPEDTQAARIRRALESDELTGKNGDTRAIETHDRESGSDEWTRARGERR